MKELRHVMIDLETLDLIPSARIVSIGAVIFDPRYGKISSDKFYTELDHKAQTERTKDADTINWWKTQPAEVKKALKGTATLPDALDDLAFWLPGDCRVWGNGATFDISMLEDAYRQCEIEIPWHYWNVRDQRTIKDMYQSMIGSLERGRRGTVHNALDDAYYQAKDVIMMWKKILAK